LSCSSGAESMHHGAVNSTSRKMPLVRRTAFSISESASMGQLRAGVWGHVTRGFEPSGVPRKRRGAAVKRFAAGGGWRKKHGAHGKAHEGRPAMIRCVPMRNHNVHHILSQETSMDMTLPPNTLRYAKCIENSKRIRWDIDRDVIRGRNLDFKRKFLPDGLSMVARLSFLTEAEKRTFSQVQGRTYANMFGLVERFIGAKILEVSRDHWMGDQVALEALVRFTDEELKHQELFRRMETMTGEGMPAGYAFLPQPNDVAHAVLAASTWAVLGLTCLIELFTQVHYRTSIEPDANLSELWKDVFMYHWREESQHAILDELEWIREDAKLDAKARDRAVDDLIGLAGAVDGIVQMQAKADAEYFLAILGRPLAAEPRAKVAEAFLKAYRFQYIVSGVQDERFGKILGGLITAAQGERIGKALEPIVA